MKYRNLLYLITCFGFFVSCSSMKNSELTAARKNVTKNQSENFYLQKGYEYLRNVGESSYDAIANFEMALKSNPYNGHFYNEIANCYRGGLNDFVQAEKYYNKALEYGFDKNYVYYNRAICKYNKGDLSGAISDSKTAKEKGWLTDPYGLHEKINLN